MNPRNAVRSHGRLTLTLLAVIAVAVSCIVVCAPGESDAVEPDIHWEMDGTTLRITGTGDIPDYSYYTAAPWTAAAHDADTLSIGDGITRIGDFAFNGLSNLQIVSMGPGPVSVGEYAFRNCVSLDTVALATNLEEIDPTAFERCFSLSYFIMYDTSEHYSTDDGVLFSADGKTLIKYPSGKKDTSYTVPDGTERIAREAFADVPALENLVFPASVKEIRTEAVIRCDNLETITFSEGLEHLDRYAVSDCPNITDVIIPSTVTSVGEAPFKGCFHLETIVNSSPNYAVFGGALYDVGLTTLIQHPAASKSTVLEVPTTIKTVGSYALYYARNLETADIPVSVETIGDYAFAYSGIVSAVIPENVKEIGDGIFAQCDSLETASVNAGSAVFGKGIFEGCPSLKNASVSGGTAGFIVPDRMFYGCTALKSVELENVSIIGPYAFAYCLSLPSITLSAPLNTISECAFDSCYSLAIPAFPDTLESIGFGAFMSCGSEGVQVNLPASLTTLGFAAFADSPVQSFSVAPGNTELCTKDGVLFSADGTDLIAYPSEATASSYAIPDGTVMVWDFAFRYVESLTSVSVPASVISLSPFNFDYSPITAYTVDPANASYVSVDGVIFTKDMTQMVKYPSAADAKSYTVPDGVVVIGPMCFDGASGLNSISIPASVTFVSQGSFSGCTSLRQINVDSANTAYCSMDGVLLNKDRTTLECMPTAYRGSFIIPATVSQIPNGMVYCEYKAKVEPGSNYFYADSDGWLYSADLTTLYYVPANVSTVVIPDYVLTVASQAVSGPKVDEIRFEDGSMAEVEILGFYDCSNLSLIRFYDGSRIYFDGGALYFEADEPVVITFDAPDWFRMGPSSATGPVIYDYTYTAPLDPFVKFNPTFLEILLVVTLVVGGLVLVLRRGEPVLE